MTEQNVQPAVSEVSDVLPCVQHKTGALHSIVCWVNCPKTRNEEFGQLLEALTEKYCQTVMKLDELIGQFDTLKGKNDKVIKFQEENFSKHDNGIEDVVAQHKNLVTKQEEDHQLVMKHVEA